MADDRAFRISIRYDADDNTFTASIPELDVSTTADTRADALTFAEDALDERIQAAAEGDPLPVAIDASEVSAPLTLELSGSLQRELRFQARQAKMLPEALAAEVLARGIGQLEGKRHPPEPAVQPQNDADRARARDDNRGGNRRRSNNNNRREGYRPDMDDQANFLEYVRNLERGGRGGGGGNRR